LCQVDQVDQDFWQLKFQLGIGPNAARPGYPGFIGFIIHLIYLNPSHIFL